MTKITAQISILAMQDGNVHIIIDDKDSGVRFANLVLTSEQYVRATMTRLACCDVETAEVFALDKVGKKQEYKKLEFSFPDQGSRDLNKIVAAKTVDIYCDEGWIPDTEFNSQNSFFEKNGVHYARTTIRRWV